MCGSWRSPRSAAFAGGTVVAAGLELDRLARHVAEAQGDELATAGDGGAAAVRSGHVAQHAGGEDRQGDRGGEGHGRPAAVDAEAVERGAAAIAVAVVPGA